MGAIVVETKGPKTGRTFNVPLLAAVVGDLVVVTTIRPKSQWLKNLAQNPEVRYWMWGRTHEATAFVFAPGLEIPRQDAMPVLARCLAAGLLPLTSLYGIAFAILSPVDRNHGDSLLGMAREPTAPGILFENWCTKPSQEAIGVDRTHHIQ